MIVGNQDPFPQRRPPAPRANRGGRSWLWLVLGMLMTLLVLPARAEDRGPLILTGPASIEMTGRHFDYLMDHDWSLRPADLIGAGAAAMQPMPGTVPDFGYTTARLWLRLHLANRTADTNDWRFFVQANFTQQIAVYLARPDGTITTILDLTTDSPFSARPVDYPQMVAPFRLAPGEDATLLVAYYSQGSSRISMSVETLDSFVAQARIQEAKNYAFYGMMAVLAAMATVALLVLRRLVFAAYVAYVLSVLTYIAHGDGVAFQLIWPNLPQFNSMASIVLGSCGMVFGGVFAIIVLQTARYHAVMHRILLAVIVALLVLDVALWATAPQLLKQVLVVMISVSTLTYIAAGIVAARTRFRAVRFYLFAWLAGLIPAALFTARFVFGLETTFIAPYDAIRLALVADALMMGLAVFDSYNQQRQAALEETLAHAQRNLALGKRLAILEGHYEDVRSASREREESVKDTVHDLRQPMQALRLSLRQMLNPEARGAPDIAQVETALGYMEKLVADRLAGDPGAASVEVPTIDEPRLHAVLQGVTDMFAAEAEAKGLTLRLVLASADAEVSAYPLMRVVANLVSNAIKYTGEGRILIALRSEGSGKRVEIHDTGPGLNGAAFERALLRNERLERDRDTAAGSGLGLAVVKEIADANGWQLTSCATRTTGASIRLHLPPDGGSREPLRRAEGRAESQMIA